MIFAYFKNDSRPPLPGFIPYSKPRLNVSRTAYTFKIQRLLLYKVVGKSIKNKTARKISPLTFFFTKLPQFDLKIYMQKSITL